MTVKKSPALKAQDRMNAMELELGRRRPETPDGTTTTPSVLDGLMVAFDRASWEAADNQICDAAVRAVINYNLKHECTKVTVDSPPCLHKDHWRDMALLRGDLMRLGLWDNRIEQLPLAIAVRAKRKELGRDGPS